MLRPVVIALTALMLAAPEVLAEGASPHLLVRAQVSRGGQATEVTTGSCPLGQPCIMEWGSVIPTGAEGGTPTFRRVLVRVTAEVEADADAAGGHVATVTWTSEHGPMGTATAEIGLEEERALAIDDGRLMVAWIRLSAVDPDPERPIGTEIQPLPAGQVAP